MGRRACFQFSTGDRRQGPQKPIPLAQAWQSVALPLVPLLSHPHSPTQTPVLIRAAMRMVLGQLVCLHSPTITS